MLPLVLLLDIDGTILGDATQHACALEMCDLMGWPRKRVQEDLVSKRDVLLRPHFAHFMKTLAGSSVECFVYTAASPAWAQVATRAIEQCTGIKLNRPVFNRRHCVVTELGLFKSIDRVLPLVYNALKHRYILSNVSQLRDKVLLIDNNRTIYPYWDQRIMVCPSFVSAAPCDLLHLLTSTDHPKLASILAKYRLNSKVSTDAHDIFWWKLAHILSQR